MAPPPPLPRPTWWDRNWKWFVPVLAFAGLSVIAAFVVGVMALLKQAEPYQLALARAREHPAIVAALGTPIEDAFFVTGSRQVNAHGADVRGTGTFTTRLTGPKGKATLWVEASRANGPWRLDRALVQIDGRDAAIDLSDPPARK